MPDDARYEWRPALCPVCVDPAARLVRGDSDRFELLLCVRCPDHGQLPYRDLAEVLAVLPRGAVLAMRGEVLYIGAPAAPPGVNAYTQSVVAGAVERGFVPVWHASPRRHRVVLTAPVPDGAWGWLEIGARSGRILRAGAYPDGRRGPEVSADGATAVRRLVRGLRGPVSPSGATARGVAADPR
ncbi:hypothetical protein ACFRFJ_42345 [Streptomyces hydrogenans]|uniref:hypothetical protein n=1 Tax=Streptomyces hydrogenans TaxID=1873719 RepID=UPI003631857C